MASLDYGGDMDMWINLLAVCRLLHAKPVGFALAFAAPHATDFQVPCSPRSRGATPQFIALDLMALRMLFRPCRALHTSAAVRSTTPDSRHTLKDKDPLRMPSVQEVLAKLHGTDVTLDELSAIVDALKRGREIRNLRDAVARLHGAGGFPATFGGTEHTQEGLDASNWSAGGDGASGPAPATATATGRQLHLPAEDSDSEYDPAEK